MEKKKIRTKKPLLKELICFWERFRPFPAPSPTKTPLTKEELQKEDIGEKNDK